MADASAPRAFSLIAASENLELVLPECQKGIGAVIQAPDSGELIAGVRVQPFSLRPDDRGYFVELLRMGQGLVGDYPASSIQVSAALSYPGAIKAFHYHLRQRDCWAPVMGALQVALVDLRRNSSTFGARNTMYVGVLCPWQLLVPPGVAHGYKVIGTEAALLFYVTDRFYDPQDEGRIAYNDASINYDWETQRK
jgi:dTDP-4-dehydrorhamnose 3,5-epimerase